MGQLFDVNFDRFGLSLGDLAESNRLSLALQRHEKMRLRPFSSPMLTIKGMLLMVIRGNPQWSDKARFLRFSLHDVKPVRPTGVGVQ
ncbi:hypothetical protein I41_09380 [Lacipirellula limnantheis]|uniref:Uncharacterized protein n=1 Tax=Lacipirellula limnantheis TaxID=2528024 RepID=A0A517TTS3_9BACT|nr:hypothetical protein I41_09380 [Lacipirellula limnantheis]